MPATPFSRFVRWDTFILPYLPATIAGRLAPD
jgi:hypothetical protein